MKRTTILTFIFALVAMTGWGQKVWTNPGYRNVPKGFQFDVNEVEFRPDETVLHITVRNRPNAWFSFGKSTVLKTENDKSYPIISAKKTRDGETDLALDKHIPLPKSVTPERIKANMDVFGFDIDIDDIKIMDTISHEGLGITPNRDPDTTTF